MNAPADNDSLAVEQPLVYFTNRRSVARILGCINKVFVEHLIYFNIIACVIS